MTDKTVWDGVAFAELAARLKAVEGRLDKLERPWVEARAQRQREIDAGKAAGDREIFDKFWAEQYGDPAVQIFPSDNEIFGRTADAVVKEAVARRDRGEKSALDASIADLLEEIVRLEQKNDELRLHIKARDLESKQLRGEIARCVRQNSDLQIANNQYLERARAAEAKLQDELDNAREN
jgi:serine phosphatase RsbU (regulator of sigma subunit)